VQHKPQVVSVDGLVGSLAPVKLAYNGTFTIQYTQDAAATSTVNVTSVVLVAPSVSHLSWNSNQRVIKLHLLEVTPTEVTVTAPAHPYTAPPQTYMMFLVNGKTYSAAQWVSLDDLAGFGKGVPPL
jgi:hypothetical protein